MYFGLRLHGVNVGVEIPNFVGAKLHTVVGVRFPRSAESPGRTHTEKPFVSSVPGTIWWILNGRRGGLLHAQGSRS